MSALSLPLCLSVWVQGPHVIHDPTLVLALNSYLVEKSTAYINHGTLHLLRVPPGKIAQVWYGVQAVLLESQTEPYVVVSPLFRYDKLVEQSAALISHGTSHRVRVPRGRLAKVWVDNVPLLLNARQEHYEYVDALLLLRQRRVAGGQQREAGGARQHQAHHAQHG